MNAHPYDDRRDERGSALVIAVLVMAILTLLGISFVLMADTENKIATNEKLSAQALYFGESVVREVKRWFDRPPYGAFGNVNLAQPTTASMDRTLRQIDTDGDGPTAAVAADGSAGAPYYKVGIDRDGDGHDDIFDKPYRTALADMLVGTEAGPDVRISRAAGGAQKTLLDALSDKLTPNFPNGAMNVRARIDDIDVYEPPYISIAGTWTRYGVGTVKVTVSIYNTSGGTTQTLATRIVKAVINETPYPGPFGPLHSCDELQFNGNFFPHWGTSTAVGNLDIGNGADNKIPHSIPRALPPTPQLDLLYGYDNIGTWNTLKANLNNQSIEDPWYRFIVGGTCNQWNAALQQPYPPTTAGPDWSNKMHQMPGVGCPDFDYDTWKQIAQSGGSDTHYFAWDNGTNFRENGSGTATAFSTLTDNKTGLFFFDTTDSIAPHDFDPTTGVAANLTPQIKITSGYGTRGFLYLNTVKWDNAGNPGRSITMHWPGEPYRDANQNGVHDAGEDWINLDYTTISTTDPSVAPTVKSGDTYDPAAGGVAIWNARGPNITGQKAVVWGVLYVTGDIDIHGTPLYYGSVVTKAGTDGKSSGTPDLYWDTDLKDNFPPPGWDLPRVIITRWQTDL